jgi:hypothetical protein
MANLKRRGDEVGERFRGSLSQVLLSDYYLSGRDKDLRVRPEMKTGGEEACK